MRTLLVAALVLTALVAVAAPASADQYGVGDCRKVCAAVCVSDADTTCWDDGAVCVGFSYQIPQCVPKQS
jgi:hypothetical protein